MDKLRVFVYLSDNKTFPQKAQMFLRRLSDKCQIQIVCRKYYEEMIKTLRKFCILYNIELKTIKTDKERWKERTENLSILKAVRYTDIAVVCYAEEAKEIKDYICNMMDYYEKKSYCIPIEQKGKEDE